MANYKFEQIKPYMIPCRLKEINSNINFFSDEYSFYHVANMQSPIAFKEDTVVKKYISGILVTFTNKQKRQISRFFNNDGKLICTFHNYDHQSLLDGNKVTQGENTITVFDNLISCDGFVNGKLGCLAYDYEGNSYEANSQTELIEKLKSENKYLPIYIDCEKYTDHDMSM